MFAALRVACLALAGTFLAAGAAHAFGFDDVAELARRDAAAPYRAPEAPLPAVLQGLGYDGMRQIRFKPAHALWRREGLPFELQLFHRGGDHPLPVQLHEVADGRVRELPYTPEAWDFGKHRFPRSGWAGLGHAGFRVHHALNTPAYKDELIVFLGASYFRALGRGQQYGLSARALAIDTVGAPAGQAEEFPRFKAFWIERPAPGAQALVIHALLDSPRVAGAYRFVVRPGVTTTVDVQQRLFLRAGVARVATLGLAPLTSMFLHGESQPRGSDWRPEVHDSDGLQVAADGEWLWRPLFNPRAPLASSLSATQLQGYGLMQRDRRFASYEDDEAHYERRPSAWVEPVGRWGRGRVELLQLPTPDETHDNVVAYWVPATLPAPGQPLDLAWRLHWQGTQQTTPPQAWVTQARRGHGWARPERGELQFMLDFDGPALRSLPADTKVMGMASAVSAATAGAGVRVLEARSWRHPQGGWRLQLRVQRDDPTEPVELRAWLRQGPHALSETWAALVPGDASSASPSLPASLPASALPSALLAVPPSASLPAPTESRAP